MIVNKMKEASLELLPVMALSIVDQETGLLWFVSFDLFCLLLESRCLLARRCRDKP